MSNSAQENNNLMINDNLNDLNNLNHYVEDLKLQSPEPINQINPNQIIVPPSMPPNTTPSQNVGSVNTDNLLKNVQLLDSENTKLRQALTELNLDNQEKETSLAESRQIIRKINEEYSNLIKEYKKLEDEKFKLEEKSEGNKKVLDSVTKAKLAYDKIEKQNEQLKNELIKTKEMLYQYKGNLNNVANDYNKVEKDAKDKELIINDLKYEGNKFINLIQERDNIIEEYSRKVIKLNQIIKEKDDQLKVMVNFSKEINNENKANVKELTKQAVTTIKVFYNTINNKDDKKTKNFIEIKQDEDKESLNLLSVFDARAKSKKCSINLEEAVKDILYIPNVEQNFINKEFFIDNHFKTALIKTELFACYLREFSLYDFFSQVFDTLKGAQEFQKNQSNIEGNNALEGENGELGDNNLPNHRELSLNELTKRISYFAGLFDKLNEQKNAYWKENKQLRNKILDLNLYIAKMKDDLNRYTKAMKDKIHNIEEAYQNYIKSLLEELRFIKEKYENDPKEKQKEISSLRMENDKIKNENSNLIQANYEKDNLIQKLRNEKYNLERKLNELRTKPMLKDNLNKMPDLKEMFVDGNKNNNNNNNNNPNGEIKNIINRYLPQNNGIQNTNNFYIPNSNIDLKQKIPSNNQISPSNNTGIINSNQSSFESQLSKYLKDRQKYNIVIKTEYLEFLKNRTNTNYSNRNDRYSNINNNNSNNNNSNINQDDFSTKTQPNYSRNSSIGLPLQYNKSDLDNYLKTAQLYFTQNSGDKASKNPAELENYLKNAQLFYTMNVPAKFNQKELDDFIRNSQGNNYYNNTYDINSNPNNNTNSRNDANANSTNNMTYSRTNNNDNNNNNIMQPNQVLYPQNYNENNKIISNNSISQRDDIINTNNLDMNNINPDINNTALLLFKRINDFTDSLPHNKFVEVTNKNFKLPKTLNVLTHKIDEIKTNLTKMKCNLETKKQDKKIRVTQLIQILEQVEKLLTYLFINISKTNNDSYNTLNYLANIYDFVSSIAYNIPYNMQKEYSSNSNDNLDYEEGNISNKFMNNDGNNINYQKYKDDYNRYKMDSLGNNSNNNTNNISNNNSNNNFNNINNFNNLDYSNESNITNAKEKLNNQINQINQRNIPQDNSMLPIDNLMINNNNQNFVQNNMKMQKNPNNNYNKLTLNKLNLRTLKKFFKINKLIFSSSELIKYSNFYKNCSFDEMLKRFEDSCQNLTQNIQQININQDSEISEFDESGLGRYTLRNGESNNNSNNDNNLTYQIVNEKIIKLKKNEFDFKIFMEILKHYLVCIEKVVLFYLNEIFGKVYELKDNESEEISRCSKTYDDNNSEEVVVNEQNLKDFNNILNVLFVILEKTAFYNLDDLEDDLILNRKLMIKLLNNHKEYLIISTNN